MEPPGANIIHITSNFRTGKCICRDKRCKDTKKKFQSLQDARGKMFELPRIVGGKANSALKRFKLERILHHLDLGKDNVDEYCTKDARDQSSKPEPSPTNATLGKKGEAKRKSRFIACWHFHPEVIKLMCVGQGMSFYDFLSKEFVKDAGLANTGKDGPSRPGYSKDDMFEGDVAIGIEVITGGVYTPTPSYEAGKALKDYDLAVKRRELTTVTKKCRAWSSPSGQRHAESRERRGRGRQVAGLRTPGGGFQQRNDTAVREFGQAARAYAGWKVAPNNNRAKFLCSKLLAPDPMAAKKRKAAEFTGWKVKGELTRQAGMGHFLRESQQAQPCQQVEQIARHRVIHEQPAPAEFNEMAVAHDPYDEVVTNEDTIEFNGNGREAESAPMAPGLPPPAVDRAADGEFGGADNNGTFNADNEGQMVPPEETQTVVNNEETNGREAESEPGVPPPVNQQSACIFDSYYGDKVDMTQDDGSEDCIQPESSKKGVEYVLKVAEKVVKVKREQIEETNEAKVAAETRAAAAEEAAMEAKRALEAATKTKKLTNRVRDHQLCSLGNLPRGEIETRLLEILLRSGASNDEEASKEVDMECMVCCEPYEVEAHRSRVICSADGGCGTFAMCRLCVFRSSIILEDPVQIDNEAAYGAFDYDTSVCPQCRKEGAFQEDELPPLPGDVKRTVEAEIWEGRDREQIAAAQHAFEDGNDEDDGDYEGNDYEPDVVASRESR